jgi:hypothetical protein
MDGHGLEYTALGKCSLVQEAFRDEPRETQTVGLYNN